MNTLLELINGYILGPVVPIILFACGIYFTIKLRFFMVRHPIKTLAPLFRKNEANDGVSPLAAVTLALAGTLGVGNIVGVATAIIMGGAGAIFWMWVSALVAMVLKYAEIVATLQHRVHDGEKYRGGPMYYIKSKPIAVTFCILCILCSFALGNALQVSATAQSFDAIFGVPPIVIGLIMATLIFFVLFRHKKGVFNFTLRLVPAITLFYIVLSLIVIIALANRIPAVLTQIFTEAFNFRSATGGISGFLIIMTSVRFGVIRGLVSNEAGCGTAPIAHAAVNNTRPATQGCWGILEVFIDTILMCTLTAFVVLLPGIETSRADGMTLILESFGFVIGSLSGIALTFSFFAFAFATTIGWSYFGVECIHFLSKGKRSKTLYLAVFNILALFGGFVNAELVWHLSDFTIGAMTVINAVFLFTLRKDIFFESDKYFKYPASKNFRE